MNFEFTQKLNKDDLIFLPKTSLLNKIGSASEKELKILLYASAVASEKEIFDENDIQNISGLDLTEIIIALQFWRGAEVLCASGENYSTLNQPKKTEKVLQKNDMPTYSGEEISKLFEKNTEIRLLIDECQNIAGKIFNPHEINKIVSLYDYLGLSCEYILSVYNYCKNKNKTTVHYIEKTALNLYNEGVDTDEKLLEYLKYKEQFDSIAGKIRRIFGIGSRSLTKKEEDIIKKWTEGFKFELDIIEYAYELTVNATNKPSLPYASKILENWFTKGIKTLDEAKSLEFDYKNAKQSENQNKESSFDSDEFFEAALKKSYDNLGKKPQN
ncbi:MAG: DnaD domain protein [Ruminococcaceae bacterium]|nr:DnaD domain protein [Oscillospiraceae bacterium]